MKLSPLGAVVVLAAVVRAAFVVVFLRHPVSDIVPQDMASYTELARAVLDGDFRHRLFAYVNAPYAFLIAPFTLLPPLAATWAVAALQVALDLASVVLIDRIGRRVFGVRAALAGAVLYALYGTAIYYTAVVLPVTLSILALLGATAAVLHCRDGTPRGAVLAGALVGLLVLIRPNALLVLLAAVVWLAPSGRRRVALLLAGATAVLAPFAVRSVAAGRGPSPFPVNGGINFYIGNNPHATGTYGHVLNVDDRPLEQIVTSVEEASRRAGRTLDERAASAFWFDEALYWMRRDPAAALRLTLLKVAWLLRNEEVSLNASYPFVRAHVGVLRATLTFGVLVPFAAWGLVAALAGAETRRDPGVRLLVAFAGAFALSVVAFFISDRYRIPLAGLLAVFAGHGVVDLAARVRGRRVGSASAAIAFTVACAVAANHRFAPFRYEEPMPRFSLAAAYFERGRVDEGLAECEAGLAVAGDLPQGYHCRATAYAMKNDLLRAETNLREAVRRAGFFKMSVRTDLAAFYAQVGLYEEALRVTDDDAQRAALQAAYDEDVRRAPDRRQVARKEHAAGSIASGAGRLAEARYAYKRAVQADPTHAAAWRDLARVCGELGLAEEGCEAASQAVWLAAGDGEARRVQQQLCAGR